MNSTHTSNSMRAILALGNKSKMMAVMNIRTHDISMNIDVIEFGSGRERESSRRHVNDHERTVRPNKPVVDLRSVNVGARNGALIVDSGTERPVVGSSRVDLQACKLEYSIVSPK